MHLLPITTRNWAPTAGHIESIKPTWIDGKLEAFQRL